MGGTEVAVPERVAGRYRVTDVLGVSRGLETWRATDERTGEVVIVKSGRPPVLSATVRLRLELESDVLQRLNHPWLAPLLDWGWEPDVVYFVQPFVPGMTLAERLRQGPLAPAEWLTVARCLAAALAEAHEHGVCHGAVNPANVVVDGATPLTRATLIDFGLVRRAALVPSGVDQSAERARYLSPEQAGSLPRPVDVRSDLYSLGVVLYECVAGHPPFEGAGLGEVLRQHLSAPPPPLPHAGVALPGVVDEIVRRLLGKDPADRYQSASALVADLEAVADGAARGETGVVIGGHDRRRSLAEPALVGRQVEVATFEAYLEQAGQGDGKLVLLESESGGGKSRLLEEVGRRAAARGFWVLRGQGAGDAPLRPLHVLGGVVDGIGDRVDADPELAPQLGAGIGQHREALAEVFPELRAVLGGADGPVGPAAFGEARSAAAVAALVDALGNAERPAVVLLDDCQWADELSVQALTVWERIPSPPGSRHVLVVASFRSDEVFDGHPLRRATSAGVRLRPLGKDAIRQLAESMAGPLPAPALSVVLDLARGNPFMAVAVLHGLTETGALVPGASGWRFEATVAGLQSSRRVAEVLVQRLDRLNPEARHLLSAGAVLGREFDLELAAGLVGLPLAAALAAADEAERRQLVWTAKERCTFVHDRLRDACLSRLSAAARAQLHQQAAAVLQASDPVPAFDVAYHLDAAGMHSEAVPYALTAAAVAQARHSLQVAEEQYRIADRGLDPSDKRRALVAEGLGQVLMLRGRYDEAEHQLIRARSLADDDAAAARLEGELGELAFKRGDVEGASDRTERALRLLGQRMPRWTLTVLLLLWWELVVLLARPLRRRLPRRRRDGGAREAAVLTAALYARLLYAWWFRRGTLAAAWAQLRLLHLADRCPPSRELGHAYAIHGAALTAAAPFLCRRGRSFAARAVAMQDEVGDLWGRGQARHFQAVVLHACCRYADAAATCTEASELLDGAGDRWELNTAAWHRALCRYRLGDLGGAIDEAEAVHHAGVELGDAQAAAMGLEIWAKASGGQVPAEAVRQALDGDGRDVQTTVALLQAEGLRLLAAARIDDAVEVLERAERLIRRRRVANVYVAAVKPWLATAKRRAAEDAPAWAPRRRALLRRRARRAARRAVRFSRLYRNDRPHALREAALVAAMGGHPRRARRLLGRSLAVATRQGAAAEAAETRRVRSEMARVFGWDEVAADRAARPLTTGFDPGLDGAGAVPAATTPGLADRLDALLDAGRRLASTSSSEALNEAVQDAIVALLRPEWCGVAPVNVDGYLTPGEDPDPMWRRLQALVAQALDARRAVVLRDGAGSVAGDRLPIGGVRSALAAPVLAGGRPVAVVLATHSLADLFGETEERLAGFVVALAGAARERDLVQRAVRGEVIAAQEAERTRVARDLHDEVGQSLTSVILTLRLLEASLEATPGDMHGPLTRVAEVRDLANDTLRQVRRLVFELRPPALDDLGLVAAVRRLVGEITYRHAVAVDLVTAGLDDAPRFRPEVETTVYRVIQEALTNMVRHSGTDAGSVILAYGPDGLRAVVEDEGVGFHPELTTLASFGLRGMAERAELVGGALRITSAPGSGTAVVLEVPLA